MEEKIQSCLVYYTYKRKKWIIRFLKCSQVGTKWLCKLARNSVYPDSFFCLIMCLVQFSSVAQSCQTPCDPMDCTMPGLPVYHQLPEFTQTHVHWEKAIATHSSTLAWKIPWTEEPGRLQSMGSISRTRLSKFTFTFHFHALEKEIATHSSVLAWSIPGMGSLVGCHLWGRTESDTTEVT